MEDGEIVESEKAGSSSGEQQLPNWPQLKLSARKWKCSGEQDKRSVAICVRNLPMRSSDTSLKDGLLHMYRKLDRGVTVKVVGQGSDRAFIIRFNKLEDVEKALEFSRDKFLFDRKIEATPWDSDLEPEPKSSRSSSTAVQHQLSGSFSSPASGNQKTKESKSTTTNSTTCTNALKSSSSIAGLESSKLKSSSKSGGGQSSSSSVSKKESDKGKEKSLEEERERRKKKQNSSKTSATILVSSTSSAPTSAGTPSSASSTEGIFRIPHPHGTSVSPSRASAIPGSPRGASGESTQQQQHMDSSSDSECSSG